MNDSQPYVLATGAAGAERLRLLQRLAGPGTLRALQASGLAAGMSAVDIGCGIGTVTRQIAERVGDTGRVTGVDASAAQIEVARRECQELARVAFTVASAYCTNLPSASYDFVYCRFLLCHLERPADAIAEMGRLLRPRGILLCEDQEGSTLTSVPPTEAYTNAARRSLALGHKGGVNLDLGPHLPGMVRGAGFGDVRVTIHQEAYFTGPEKRFYEITIAESMPQVVASGATTQDEVEARLAAIRRINDDESILVVMPRIWQLWGVKR